MGHSCSTSRGMRNAYILKRLDVEGRITLKWMLENNDTKI
jgi:hypothetical protein